MSRVYEGNLAATGLRFGIVVARFNELVTERLLQGALAGLTRHGADPDKLDVVYVPGAFELPYAVHRLVESGRYAAVIALGAVIRGETPHFDYVAGEAAKGIAHAALSGRTPTIFGVLTTDTLDQALARAGSKAGNKGWDAALAAIEMANLNRLFPE
ncbi:MAG: 6,7-dimethyl-8-ribityllumazine synthase [Firmicutes bacterium]|nr:6,7-dimethyl-8-ribityllumazine synthase [Bacillota bacterium]